MTVNYKPGSKLDPLRREFLKYVFSRDGQDVVVKVGYYPLPARLCTKSLKAVGIPAGN
jgi:phosphate transport system substrate-binding protein